MRTLYGAKSKYHDRDRFTPDEIKRAIDLACTPKTRGASLIYDKNATPAEPATNVAELSATLRPIQIVEERSSSSMTTAHNEHTYAFSRYQTLDVQTGSTMLNQFYYGILA